MWNRKQLAVESFWEEDLKPLFASKPVVQRIPRGDEHSVDQDCRFWSRLLSRLKFLALLVERNRGIRQGAGIIAYIRNTMCPRLRSMILKTDLGARKTRPLRSASSAPTGYSRYL